MIYNNTCKELRRQNKMNKQEIAQKLDEMVKSMPGTFYVHNDGDLNLE